MNVKRAIAILFGGFLFYGFFNCLVLNNGWLVDLLGGSMTLSLIVAVGILVSFVACWIVGLRR